MTTYIYITQLSHGNYDYHGNHGYHGNHDTLQERDLDLREDLCIINLFKNTEIVCTRLDSGLIPKITADNWSRRL